MKLARFSPLILPIALFSILLSLATAKTEGEIDVLTSLNREGTIIDAHVIRELSNNHWDLIKLATLTPAKVPVQAYNFLAGGTPDNILLDGYRITGAGSPFKLGKTRYDVEIDAISVQFDPISSKNYPGVYGGRILEAPCTVNYRGLVYEQNGFVKYKMVNNAGNPVGMSWELYPGAHLSGDVPLDVAFGNNYTIGVMNVFNQNSGYRLHVGRFNERLQLTFGVAYRLGENVVDVALGDTPPNKDFITLVFGSFRTNSAGRAEYRYGERNLKLNDFSLSGGLKIFKNYTPVDDAFLQSKNMIVPLRANNAFLFSYIGKDSFVQKLNVNGGKLGPSRLLLYGSDEWVNFRSYRIEELLQQ